MGADKPCSNPPEPAWPRSAQGFMSSDLPLSQLTALGQMGIKQGKQFGMQQPWRFCCLLHLPQVLQLQE